MTDNTVVKHLELLTLVDILNPLDQFSRTDTDLHINEFSDYFNYIAPTYREWIKTEISMLTSTDQATREQGDIRLRYKAGYMYATLLGTVWIKHNRQKVKGSSKEMKYLAEYAQRAAVVTVITQLPIPYYKLVSLIETRFHTSLSSLLVERGLIDAPDHSWVDVSLDDDEHIFIQTLLENVVNTISSFYDGNSPLKI